VDHDTNLPLVVDRAFFFLFIVCMLTMTVLEAAFALLFALVYLPIVLTAEVVFGVEWA
jgi:hypothetical protein